MLITKEIGIDMGHRVPNHKSKCRNPHGHRYQIEVGVDDKVITAEGTSSNGMVIDFGDLKEIMMMWIDKQFDHSYTLWTEDEQAAIWQKWGAQGLKINFVNFVPTVENLAKYWYEILKKQLAVVQIKIKYVKVWETPASTATYQE